MSVSRAKAWLSAIRPATLCAGVVPVAVGTALAANDGALRWPVALAALAGALAIQVATNLYNDCVDFETGADTEDRLGPARATQRGWLTPRQVLSGAYASLAIAVAVGAYLVWVAGWPIAALGAVSLVLALAYSGGPLPLAYVGLGDAFVLAFFGLGAVCGSYYAQAERVTWPLLLASLAIGLLATAILVVNNLRDRATDARANKRTLAVRFGARFARAEYAACVVGAYALIVATWLSGLGGGGWLLPLLSLPFAAALVRALAVEDGVALNGRLGGTAKLHLLFGALLCVGVLL